MIWILNIFTAFMFILICLVCAPPDNVSCLYTEKCKGVPKCEHTYIHRTTLSTVPIFRCFPYWFAAPELNSLWSGTKGVFFIFKKQLDYCFLWRCQCTANDNGYIMKSFHSYWWHSTSITCTQYFGLMQNSEHQQTNICKTGCVANYKFLIIGTMLLRKLPRQRECVWYCCVI